jgi:hypothetical protein
VTAVFAQVQRDAVGPAREGFARECDDVRLGVRGLVGPTVTRLAERRGVVDVDAKEEGTGGHRT